MVGMIRLDSKAEAKRYLELKLLAQGEQISESMRQIAFALYGKNGASICQHRADFLYPWTTRLPAPPLAHQGEGIWLPRLAL